MSSTVPLNYSRGQKIATTWSSTFATDEQFAKTFKGSLASLCRMQDSQYDDVTTGEQKFNDSRRYPLQSGERPYSICSTLRDEDVRSEQLTPPSDATLVSCSEKKIKPAFIPYVFEVTQGKNLIMSPEPQTEYNWDYEFPPKSNSVEGSNVFLPVSSAINRSQVDQLQNQLSDRDPLDADVPMTPGTFHDSRKDLSLSVRNRILPNLRSTAQGRPQQQNTPARLALGHHRTSISPFIRTWIYRSKTIAVALDDTSPPLYMKAPIYIIPELQYLGMQPASSSL